MPKNIILVRHGKSDWSIPGQKDFERTLNQRGLVDAPRMGNELAKLNINPSHIVSSPAFRAKATAEFVAEQLNFDIDNIEFIHDLYEASSRNVLSVINQFDNSHSTIMIFGHNPTFTHIAEYFTKEYIGNIPTCGAVNIEFEVEDWALISGQTGRLKFFIYPKMFFEYSETEED